MSNIILSILMLVEVSSCSSSPAMNKSAKEKELAKDQTVSSVMNRPYREIF